MTLALILGGAVALYFVRFLFRLAACALPVCAGVTLALALVERGVSHPASITAGLIVGVQIHLGGRALLAANIGRAWRGVVALAFAAPAGWAGFALTRALLGLAGVDGAVLLAFSLAGAATTAWASWTRLAPGAAGGAPDPAAAEAPPR